ncbi:TetR/AcrR family transcriptional regulator [uncultured Demequina sp.]|uniref:TetR/AcrR family transcriptional regulator n=1 Tax=uncultured Demequina sp. TaxID=693499 RepID=UPI0025D062FF|nr:TetR/AcrR family transcriptional regulator [uncultured Demequina sp.]
MVEDDRLDGRQRRGRDTRAHIISAAMEQFCESGYRASSLRDIAARADITHPGVLYHFPTKEALLMAVLQRRDEQGRETRPVVGEMGRAALASMAAAAAHNETQRAMVELYAVLSAEATGPDHPAHAYFTERYERLHANVLEAYTVARDAGDLVDDVEPRVAAPQLIARIITAHLNTQLRVPLDAF